MDYMKDFDIVEVIKACGEAGVTSFKVDSVEITFHNGSSKEFSTISYPAVPTPYHDDTDSAPEDRREELAAELSQLHITDPERYEELLANPDNFDRLIRDIEE